MSRWTHVAGVARIDSISFLKPLSPQWHQFLAERLTGDDQPVGSEGPLTIEVVHEPARGIAISASQGYVLITGDLRDFGGEDDTQEIVYWLNEYLVGKTEEGWWIRQGAFQIEDEGTEGTLFLCFEQACESRPNEPHWHGWQPMHKHEATEA